MPVIEHPVHKHGVRDAEHRYGCWNRPPYHDVCTAEGWRGTATWPNRFSRECRYDRSLTDSACAGCQRAGSGEEYIKTQEEKICHGN